MAILDENVLKDTEKALQNMVKEVRLVLFTQEMECSYCKETHQLLEELLSTNKLLKLEVHKFEKDSKAVKQYGIDKIPAIAIMGEKDHGIRFYGIPAGYEFSTLLAAILLVSTGKHKLTKEGMKFMDSLTKPIHMQVFVMPTCPYCPKAVMLAHQMAYYSDKITADMVEISGFPHLTQKYSVQGVPRTVINEKWYLEGAAPEAMVMKKIEEAIKHA